MTQFRMERSVLKYCTDLLVLMDRIVLRQKEGSTSANTSSGDEKRHERMLTVAEGLRGAGLKIEQIGTSFANLPSNFSNMSNSEDDTVNQQYCVAMAADITNLSAQVKQQGNELITLTGLMASSNSNENMVTLVRACWLHLPSINDIELALLYQRVLTMKNKLGFNYVLCRFICVYICCRGGGGYKAGVVSVLIIGWSWCW